MRKDLKVAYMLLHFPFLTETFVAEEIRALRAQGTEVQVLSLLSPGRGPIQPLSESLLPYTRYGPSLASGRLWFANVGEFLRHPVLYLALFWRLLTCPCPSRPLALLGKRVIIFWKAVAIAAQLRGQGVDLIHAHFAWLPAAGAWVAARLLGVPFTVTIHAYDIFTSTDLLPLIMREAAQVVAISEYNRQYVHERGLRDATEIVVIHCGIDPEQFAAESNSEAPSPVDRPLQILSVGSLNQKKGHGFLIEACALLAQRDIEFECRIIGSGSGRDRLEQQIRAAGLEGRVQLLGAKPSPEIAAAYREHDLFVLASVVADNGDRDGIPVVMMEAGAAGLPLVSTRVSGIPELVQHEKTGLLTPPKSPLALADAMTTLAHDPALRHSLGRGASRLVLAEFDVEKNAARLRTCFSEVVSRK